MFLCCFVTDDFQRCNWIVDNLLLYLSNESSISVERRDDSFYIVVKSKTGAGIREVANEYGAIVSQFVD